MQSALSHWLKIWVKWGTGENSLQKGPIFHQARVREGSMYHLDSRNCFKSILVYDRKDFAISALY